MNTTEKLMSNADRVFELLEQKSPHQLAVELAELQHKHDIALAALNKMQDQRDQLAAQLKDATAQCGVMAELLREAKESTYAAFVEAACRHDVDGCEEQESLRARIDASLAGKLPEPRTTKPARVWGARFMPGVAEKIIIEAAYRYAEYEASEEEKKAGKINFDLLMAAVHKTVPEGWQLVPAEPTDGMCEVGAIVPVKNRQSEAAWIGDIYRAMLAASPKPEGGER